MLTVVEPIETPEHELPAATGPAFALAFMAASLERRLPGFLDEWEALASEPSVHAEIRKMREPPISPDLTQALRDAVVLVRHTRLVTLAWMSERKRRKHRRGT